MTWKERWKCCSFHNQTFSHCRSESKTLSRTFAELKTDMLNTSIGRAGDMVGETVFEIRRRWIV